LEEILLGIAEAVEPIAGTAFAKGPQVGAAVVLGTGVGVTIDYFCPTCEQFGESVGGSLYSMSNPYNPNSAFVPSPPPLLSLPGPSEPPALFPLVLPDTRPSPCQ
jgi:hypothetical protein